ncbi:MAG: DUF1565 domain-containing protein [Lentisphaerae bacterium]|jgi:parallel beta-helix repeat protein|nr:DUF1565 domain-containing protein [Lentisphaerota bacterium]MBT4822257.1 DUF1565 domain-containing protein [Lentisphaerota bacterium]MBT5606848.1 DUF1565 domain-containing protein [Lentisphaerota bacterium]MBT7055294.1 DUF1565 domain-containing protein [Lentisphaerota bacterium]MBT7843075.1 DUF1565 domain-containing protein [Lentisphaerota bacterium]
MKTRQITLVSLLLLSVSLSAADLHVSRQHAAADDANPGRSDKPFRTISAAVKKLTPGDTVWVHAGVYREQVEYKAEGTSWTHPITLAVWPGDDVTVKGSDVVTGWEKHDGAVWKKTGWETNSQMVFVDGRNLQQIAGEMVDYLVKGNRWMGRVGEGLADMVEDSFYVDREAKTLYLQIAGGKDPNTASVEVSKRNFLWIASGKYLVISGFSMTHCNTSAYVNWPSVRIKGEHIVFQNNHVSWCDFTGLGISGSYIDILDSSFNDCGNSGIGGNCYRGCRLINNETSRNNWRNWSSGWHSGGFKLIPYERHLLIERHRAFDNNCDGMWVDSLGSSNITINACESARNKGNGLHYEIGQRGVVTNNLFHHNGGRGIYLSSSSYMLIAHNVCYANGMSGIVSHGTTRRGPKSQHPKGIVPARNNLIYGNILMDNLNPKLKPEGWGYRPELIMPNADKDPELFGGCHSDYNVFFRSDRRKIPFWYVWGEKVWHTLGTWQNDTGNDLHSVIADPMFVDPENGDFHLKPGSPAIGLVLALGEVGDDRDGTVRPSRGDDVRRAAGMYFVDQKLTPKERPRPSGTAQHPVPAPIARPAGKPNAGGALVVPAPGTLAIETIALPEKRVAPLVQMPTFSALSKAVSKAHFHTTGMLFKVGEIPTALAVSPAADKATVPLGKNATTLYFLLADAGTGPTDIRIARGDGVTKKLTIDEGKVISDGCATLAPAWQGVLPDGKPTQLLLLTYVNDNHWLPVNRIELQAHDGAKTAVLEIRRGQAK